jgi:hypothetical protein
MPVTRKYTLADVNEILTQSEGRNSPTSGEPGHTLHLHVGASGLQISDRLMGSVKSDATHPIIMGPGGAIAPEATHRDIWKSLNPGLNTKGAKSAYDQNLDNSKSNSGAFIDRQQAIAVGRFMLNSAEGQTKLGELDGGANRASMKMTLSMLEMSWKDAWKMYFASGDGAGGDITHLETFTQAFLLIDKLNANTIHIQTLYPIK